MVQKFSKREGSSPQDDSLMDPEAEVHSLLGDSHVLQIHG